MWITASIYSVMVQLLGWVYYFLIIQRRTLWKEKMYPILQVQVHQKVHHQMSSKSCKIYDWNSTRTSAIRIQCPVLQKHFRQQIRHRWHNQLLLSGPPHPLHQLRLIQWWQNRSMQCMHSNQDTSCKAPLGHCAHVHKSTIQVCKPGESLALRKVKHPHNGRTSVNRLPLMKQDILSQYSGCFEGIGCFPGDPYKFHLKTEHKPAQHTPRKVPIHLKVAFKEEIESLVKLGILEEVKEHTDLVNSYVIVEKDTGCHHSPNHTIKKKLRICLDPRDLNEALEREPTIHILWMK